MDQKSNIIGDFVRRKRIAANLEQQDLAAKAGIASSTLSRIENGPTVPTAAVLIKVAKALDADLMELFAELGLVTGRSLPELQEYLTVKYGCSQEMAAHLARHVEADLAL
ncbi:helix-turn-helix domain-containing protein [Actinokineospora soli]|uniref:Helix-turn-helix domain-containing protein n=1 Tax=Actinokineospora soli TaxID=1048753 RepID=A0ABW2THI7_9PSEU